MVHHSPWLLLLLLSGLGILFALGALLRLAFWLHFLHQRRARDRQRQAQLDKLQAGGWR